MVMNTINTIDTKHTNINLAIHADANKPAEQILENEQDKHIL